MVNSIIILFFKNDVYDEIKSCKNYNFWNNKSRILNGYCTNIFDHLVYIYIRT